MPDGLKIRFPDAINLPRLAFEAAVGFRAKLPGDEALSFETRQRRVSGARWALRVLADELRALTDGDARASAPSSSHANHYWRGAARIYRMLDGRVPDGMLAPRVRPK